MDPKYYESLYFSFFAYLGSDLILYIFLKMPYSSILSVGHTCHYMYQVGRRAAPQKATLIEQYASENILHALRLERYLEKLQILRQEVPFVIGGDFVLSQIASRPFWTRYIDVYISLIKPDELSFVNLVKQLFTTNDYTDLFSFHVYDNRQKYGHLVLYISVHNVIEDASRILRVHFIPEISVADYIQTKFDLTCSMVWYDIWSAKISTNHFWDQISGVGYVVNDYYLHDTGRRILQFKRDYGFRILNEATFDWFIYYHQDDIDEDHSNWYRYHYDDGPYDEDYYSSGDADYDMYLSD